MRDNGHVISSIPPRPTTVRAARLLTALLVCGLAGTFTVPAFAGPAPDSPRRFFAPWTSSAELDGAESTFLHAAGLGFLNGTELGLGVTTRLSGDEAINGVYGMVATRLGPIALGFALGGVGDGPDTDTTTTRFDVAFALRLGDGFALGFQWFGLYNQALSGPGDDIDDYDAWAISATLRPFRALSLALAVDNFDRPTAPGGGIIEPTARLGFGIRPGTERLTIGVDAARTLSDDAVWSVGGSLRVMLIPGLALGGYGHYQFDEDGSGPDIVHAGAFLGLYQGGFGFESSVDARTADGDGLGMTTLLKVGTEPGPSLVSRSNVVVKVSISGDLPERPTEDLLGSPGAGFAHWLQALDLISRDDRVSGLLLLIEGAPSWGQCWELRQAIGRLQARGKRVHAVLTVGDMRAMYLAAAADKVHLYVAGGLFLNGLSITRTYLFGLLEKLGVNAEIVKWDAYKSAPEAFTRTGPSEPAEEQTRDILTGVHDQWMTAVSGGRGISRDELLRILEQGPQTMHMALQMKLVDDLVHEDGLRKALQQEFGADVTITDRYRPPIEAWRRWSGRKAVAIIPVVGSIVDGRSAGALPIPLLGDQTTGDQTFIQSLNQAASDPDVIGIVIRVDTGGGSAIASDKMHRSVIEAAERKPLVVSFGSTAASGGYYLAAGAPTILTTPMTVTGSIGIFSGKADISGLYAMLGVTTHTERTNSRADMMGGHRPWTDAEREAARDRLKAYYDRFVQVVAEGREIPLDQAYDRAQGRVYLGDRAIALDLADAQGGLWDAIDRVRADAGVDVDEPLSLRYLGSLEALSSLQRLFASASGLDEVLAPPAPPAEGTVAGTITRLFGVLRALESHGLMAVMPWTLTIQ